MLGKYLYPFPKTNWNNNFKKKNSKENSSEISTQNNTKMIENVIIESPKPTDVLSETSLTILGASKGNISNKMSSLKSEELKSTKVSLLIF